MKMPQRFEFSPEKWGALAALIRFLTTLIRLLDELLRHHIF